MKFEQMSKEMLIAYIKQQEKEIDDLKCDIQFLQDEIYYLNQEIGGIL